MAAKQGAKEEDPYWKGGGMELGLVPGKILFFLRSDSICFFILSTLSVTLLVYMRFSSFIWAVEAEPGVGMLLCKVPPHPTPRTSPEHEFVIIVAHPVMALPKIAHLARSAHLHFDIVLITDTIGGFISNVGNFMTSFYTPF